LKFEILTLSNMAALPPIQCPAPVLNNVVNLPPQPDNPPTNKDICHATLFAKQVLDAHARSQVTADDVAAAMKYQAVVMGRTSADVAPPWFQGALNEALAGLDKSLGTRMTKMETRLNTRLEKVEAILKTLQTRQVETLRISAVVANRQLGIGRGIPFHEVPFPDGTYPTSATEQLPLLASVEVVENLTRQESKQYLQGYFPGKPIPADRRAAILLAIGCHEV
jgi:hypothetical protein